VIEHPNDPSLLTQETQQARANFHWLVLDIALFGLAVPATARFLSVYAIRLDASAALLGWMAALPSLASLLTSTMASWWRSRHTSALQALRLPALGFRLSFLLPAFTPFFPDEWQTLWLLATATLPSLAAGISSVMFLVMMRQAVLPTQLTSLLSQRALAFNLAVAVATLGFGAWLKLAPFPMNYQVMYVLAFVFSVLSLLSVLRIRLVMPADSPTAERPAQNPWHSAAFRRPAFVAALAHVTFFSILAIIPLRLVDELGADEGFMSIFSLAELGAAAFFSALTNRIAARLGNLNTIALGMAGTSLAGVAIALAPNLPLTLISAALSGGMWTMAGICLFGYFSENAPPESLTRFTTAYNQVVMLSVFIGPLLGSQLAETPLSLTTVLALGAGLRLIAAIIIRWQGAGSLHEMWHVPLPGARR
jgi:MFS family permease